MLQLMHQCLITASDVTYRLHLPDCMKCHNIFHLSLLRPFHKDDRYQPPPLPFEFNEEEGLWYELNCILKHRWTKRGRGKVIQYLVSFKGHGDEHNQWCDAKDVTQPAKDEYHQQHNVPTTATAPDTPTTAHGTPSAATQRRGRGRPRGRADRTTAQQQPQPQAPAPVLRTHRTTSGCVVKNRV